MSSLSNDFIDISGTMIKLKKSINGWFCVSAVTAYWVTHMPKITEDLGSIPCTLRYIVFNAFSALDFPQVLLSQVLYED